MNRETQWQQLAPNVPPAPYPGDEPVPGHLGGMTLETATIASYRWRMSRLGLTLPSFAFLVVVVPVSAASIDDAMMKLEPETRVEQRCNGRAMGILRREHKPFSPDEAVAYAFSEPRVIGPVVHAGGAAIRDHGRWYHLSYDCRTSDDGLSIKSFSYVLGSVIARGDWKLHYLVP